MATIQLSDLDNHHLGITDSCLLKSYRTTESYMTAGFVTPEKETPCDSAVHSDLIEEAISRERFDSDFGEKLSELKLVNVSYSVKEWVGSWWAGSCCRPRRTKQVLKNINMYMQAGYITAILGNSGSGKTSILDAISQRTAGSVSGDVLYNGQSMTEELFRKVAGYVLQADRLLANLTVLETLTYTASLKFPGLDKATKKQRVDYVLSEMGLQHVANERVGGSVVRGISGGEKRRLSIAAQLLQNTNILLLDEPTSGLDSFSARRLVETLADLAHKRNKTVLLSIHQPRSDIFNLFDDVCILSLGEQLYYGPKDKMVHYFADIGYPCPTYVNPLDYYVDSASVDRRSNEKEEMTLTRVTYLRQQYLQSDLFHDVEHQLEKNTVVAAMIEETAKNNKTMSRFVRGIKKTPVILGRMFVNIVRDRSGLAMRLLQLLALAFFMWIYCWKLPNSLPEAIQNRTGLFYQALSGPSIIAVFNGIGNFPSLRNVYYRESRDGLYGCVTFLGAYFVHIIPFHVISSFGFSIWVYWGCGLYPEASRFGIFYSIVIIQQYLGEIVTVMSLGIFYKEGIAQALAMIILTSSIHYATGLFGTMAGMPDLLVYLAYGNYFKYSTEIMLANEYHELVFTCPPEIPDLCDERNGDDYIDNMFPGAVENMNRNYGILMAFMAGMWIITIIIFRVKGIRNLQ